MIDLSTLLPTFLITDLSRNIVSYHLERFQDQFFTSPPAWFTLYMWLELVYHVPVTLWLLWGIWNGESLVQEMLALMLDGSRFDTHLSVPFLFPFCPAMCKPS